MSSARTQRRPTKRDSLGRRTGRVKKRELQEMRRLQAEEHLPFTEIAKAVGRDTRTVEKHLQGAPALLAAEEWPHGHLSTRPKDVLRGDEAGRWTSGKPQRAGDSFVLELGEARPIKYVRFLQGPAHPWDYPKRWRMTLQGADRILEEVEGEGSIEVVLARALPVRVIAVEILEPRLPADHPPATCWAADNIEIR